MNTFDFTSAPVIGKIMSATGISDGWIIISVAVAILALVFLVAWIRSAAKGRAARKELAALEQEVIGLQALTTLPPLHEGDWSYGQNEDPGSSLVFASTKELKHRREGAQKATTQHKTSSQDAQAAAGTSKSVTAAGQKAAPAAQAAATQQVSQAKSAAADSVTAQVHEAIFASVTNGHLKTGAASSNANRSKGSNPAFNAATLPTMETKGKKRGKAAKKSDAKKAADTDASLSSRIPKL